jgi:membrane protease subunit (stomatin/prohibitin family)
MPGLMRGMARTAAVVGTANAVSHRQQQKWAGQAAQQQAQYAEPVAPAQDDTAVQLQQLAALRDQGILTEAEFTAKKQQILGL